MSKKSILIIMDGWAEAKQQNASAINSANTPYIDSLYNNSEVAYTQLNTSGKNVGLPDGQMGNSEVGHLNIGAGRIVNQDIVRINKAIENNEIENNSTLQDAFSYAEKSGRLRIFIGSVWKIMS